MLPKRRFWKVEQKMTSGFSIDFSMARSPNRVLALEKCFLRNPDVIFCSAFQNLRLGGVKLQTHPSENKAKQRIVMSSRAFVFW